MDKDQLGHLVYTTLDLQKYKEKMQDHSLETMKMSVETKQKEANL